VELLAKARTVFGVHRDNLNSHAVIFTHAANDGTATNLPNGHVEDYLYQAPDGDLLLGANVEASESEVIHITNVALRARLPGHYHTLGRLDAGIPPLLLKLHCQVQGEDCWVRGV
jgi:hypothetical protein